jgi:hypothetical protein
VHVVELACGAIAHGHRFFGEARQRFEPGVLLVIQGFKRRGDP